MSEVIDSEVPSSPKPNLSAVFELINKARQCSSVAELNFLLVNLTKQLVAYQQAILYREGRGFVAASGLSELDVSSPMLIWLKSFVKHLHQAGLSGQIDLAQLEPEWASAYSEWFSGELVAVPIQLRDTDNYAYLLLFRDQLFGKEELGALEFWVNSWVLCLRVLEQSRPTGSLDLYDKISHLLIVLRERLPSYLEQLWTKLRQSALDFFSSGYKCLFKKSSYVQWWGSFKNRFKEDKKFRWKTCIVLLVFLPVRLTIIAPGEDPRRGQGRTNPRPLAQRAAVQRPKACSFRRRADHLRKHL